MRTSPDTLLRLIRCQPDPAPVSVRVLGVDDWAWRKGYAYGTLLVDLERHQVVDLLADRSPESLARWLKAHPGVEIISRDRAGSYAEGARAGAPHARQVADRWHLLVNLRQALERFLQRERAWASVRGPSPAAPPRAAGAAVPTDPPLTRAERLRRATRERRLARYERVIALHGQGVSLSDIARDTGLERKTVRRYLAAGAFPEIARRQRPSLLDPYLPYLEQRWQAGCHNAARLCQELQERGYTGSLTTVRAWRTRQAQTTPPSAKRGRRLSPRQASWLLMRPSTELTDDERSVVSQIETACPSAATARHLAVQFVDLLRDRQADELVCWEEASQASGIGELRSFAAGLGRDQDAVLAALTLPWSNGQTEGHVHRLKLIKRSMYGRARFDLLRHRVLHGQRPL